MSHDADSPIRVVVTPSQSSCFAGEIISITITFTNTNTPQETSFQTVTRAHKRSAHSISAVPLAQPPTSPRSPRTALPVIVTRKLGENDVVERKGLIGRSDLYSRRTRNPNRSLSLDMTFKGNCGVSAEQETSSEPSKTPIHVQRALGNMTSPSSPRISSPLARSASLPISPKHPHARKQSVLDGQIPPLQDISVPTTPSNLPFSLSLDPISESSPGSGSPTSHPTSAPPIIGTAPGFRSQERQANTSINPSTRRLSLRSNAADDLGRGPPVRDPQPVPMPKATSVDTTTLNTSNRQLHDRETILYSYVQFTGSLVITPVAGTVDSVQENALNSLRSSLLKRSIIGGGSMDIAAMLDPSKRRMTPATRSRPHSRTSSFSSGIFSLLSAPTSLLGSLSAAPAITSSVSQQWSPSHRSSSSFSFPASRSAPTLSTSAMTTTLNGGLGLQRRPSKELYDPESPLPTYEVQPTLLAMDVSLGPGESRSCMSSLPHLFMSPSSYKSPDTYSLSLPKNLPPTFKGRTFRFSYEFSIGVCRSGVSLGNSSANHSRVMKIPVRVYNHVNVMDLPSPYDLLWPVQCAGFPHQIAKPIIVEVPLSSKNLFQLKPPSPSKVEGSMSSVREYARFLLTTSPSSDGGDLDVDAAREREAGGLTGCREAVEILTRNPKKLSFDVNKDGVNVAVLTFTKSAYRLGETVLCIVDVNERAGRSRVLKLSAMLESHETLPMSLANRSNARLLRKTHAEHHSSLVSSTLRASFALDIPPDASPAFQIEAQGESGYLEPPIAVGPGGLEWKVRLCLLVAVASDESRKGADGVRLKTLIQDGPSGEWGISWRGAPSIAPLERLDDATVVSSPGGLRSWASYLASPFTGAGSERYHDGDELDEGDEREVDEDWSTIKVETVECEVPIKVWPGNTAFRASDVVFNV